MNRQLLACVLCGLILTAARSVSAQTPAPEQSPDWHYRFELFQMLLEEKGPAPTFRLQDALRSPSQSVIVVMGQLNGVISPQTLEQFCYSGGTALIASDSDYRAGRLCDLHGTVVRSAVEEDQYQGFDDCLKLNRLDELHPLMDGISSLIVNRSGWLRPGGSLGLRHDVVAALPERCSPLVSSGEPVLVEVRLGDRAQGRLFVAADQSLFTNGMFWHGDNALLSINMARLLCEGPRKQLWFVADQTVQGSYRQSPLLQNTPPSPPPVPPIDAEPDLATKLKLGNLLIRKLQASNVANELLANRPRNVREPYYRRGLLFALAAAILLWILWKLMSPSAGVLPGMPHRVMKSAHTLSTDRRVQSAEFGLAASMLARELCRDLTGSQDSAVWQRRLVWNSGSASLARQKKSVRKQLASVLELALNTRTVHISRRRFQAVGQTIQQLRQLHQSGQLLTEP
ncbi:MAG: hypothetical protein R3C49_07670 [Planctomycetaceae bacterium]